MMELQEIWNQLNEIHKEFVGEKTPADLQAAHDKGFYDSCGCSICHLMESITIAEIKQVDSPLIASAPELLDALENILCNPRIVAIVDRYAPGGLDVARAAIAKAEGGE